MLGYCIWKYRAKPGDESDGEPIHGNTKLEITWTVIPTVIVLFGAIYSWIVLGDIETKASDALPPRHHRTAVPVDLQLPAGQRQGGELEGPLVVPEGRQLDVRLTSLDVIHSFWVPEWRIKRDVVPAGPGGNDVDNTVEVTPDRLGTYNVVCAGLCGFGHATMRALVRVGAGGRVRPWLGAAKGAGAQPGTSTGDATGAPAETSAHPEHDHDGRAVRARIDLDRR